MYTITWIRKYYGESFTSPRPTEHPLIFSTKEEAREHLKSLADSSLKMRDYLTPVIDDNYPWVKFSFSDNNEMLRMIFSPYTEDSVTHIYTIVEN